MEIHVSRKREPKWNIEELTDAEIRSTIRYLDRELPANNDGDFSSSKAETILFTICISLIIVLLA